MTVILAAMMFVLGTIFGSLFYHWWIRPDVSELRDEIELLRDDRAKLLVMALRNYTARVTSEADRGA